MWRAVARFGIAGIWFAPAVWVTAEWLRGTVGGGFPWVLLGTSQATAIPVAQAASVVGVYGLSGLIALVSTAAAAIALSRKPVAVRPAIAVAILLVLVVALLLFLYFGGFLGGRSDEVDLNVNVDVPEVKAPDIDINVPPPEKPPQPANSS